MRPSTIDPRLVHSRTVRRPAHGLSSAVASAAELPAKRLQGRIVHEACASDSALTFVRLCLHAGLVLGQATTATLRGRVLDPQGAPVPAATRHGEPRGQRRFREKPRQRPTAPSSLPTSRRPRSTSSSPRPAFRRLDATGLVLEVGRHQRARHRAHGWGGAGDRGCQQHGRLGRHHAIRRGRGHARRARSRRSRSTAATSSSWRCWFRATRPRPTSIRPRRNSVLDLVGGPARPRRQHHDRRRGQQRRRGRRPAAERHAGVRAGVPDRHEPVHRGVRTLGVIGHQRRDQVGHRPAPRIGRRSSPATAPGRACQRPTTGRRATRPRSTASSWRARPAARSRRGRCSGSAQLEYRNQDGAVLVGTRDVADAHDPADLRPRSARRLARLGPRRLAAERR